MRDEIALFHPGTQHSRQTALALQELGRLRFFATSLFYRPDRWPYRIERLLPEPLARRVHAEFRRFAHPGLDPMRVRDHGWTEWLERAARRAGHPRLAERLDVVGNQLFARALRRDIRSAEPFALWGYNGSSLHAFRAAKARGRFCILDRTIGDWREYGAVMARVADAYPDFVAGRGWRVSAARIDADDEEYALADLVLAGSPAAADTVRRHAADRTVGDRLRVLPYCFDERLFGALPPPEPRPAGAPLRFLFLGQAGVRKGIHLLLNAFSRLPRPAATLTVVGEVQVPPATWARYADRVTHRPTVPRADVPALMRAHDMLVLPSYFEGSAVVLLEALAAGLGLIQSAAAGLGVTPATGLCLPELSEEALEAAMATALRDPARVEAWRRAAPVEARRYRFATYRDRIARLLNAGE